MYAKPDSQIVGENVFGHVENYLKTLVLHD